MKAVWNGVMLAESEETVVVEGNHHFPPESVDFSHLKPSWMGAGAGAAPLSPSSQSSSDPPGPELSSSASSDPES